MFCGVFICIHLHIFFCYCWNDWDISMSRLPSLTCKSLATSVLFPELLSFMLTHGCNLFIQTVFKWFSATKKSFFSNTSQQETVLCPCRGKGCQFIIIIIPYLLVCSWHHAGWVLASTSRLLPLCCLTCPLTHKQPSSSLHVSSIFPAQAFVFSCYVTEHKGSGSPQCWVVLPAGVQLFSLALQRLILLPSSVASHPLCHPLLLDSRRRQVVPTSRLYQAAFVVKPRRY